MRCKEAFFIVIGLIYSQSIDADFSYQQLERTYCVKKGAPYDTLALAKKACDEDTTCQGVYDKSCDDQEGYYLCPKVDKSLSSASGSCVYEKIQDASEFVYAKLTAKYCPKGGKYGNLASAKQACDGNTNCLGVYEPYCNSRPKKNEFYLCPSDNGRKQILTHVPFLNPSPSDPNPCVHKKLKAYKDGPSVTNSGYRVCSNAHGTLGWATEECNKDPTCNWLHDTYCDDRYWRFCSNEKIDDYEIDGTDSCSKLKECVDEGNANDDSCQRGKDFGMCQSPHQLDRLFQIHCRKTCNFCG